MFSLYLNIQRNRAHKPLEKYVKQPYSFKIYVNKFQQISIVQLVKYIKDMKIVESKTILLTIIVIQAALTMPTQHTQSLVDFPNEQIVGSDVSATGQFLTLMTQSMQLRVYKLYKQTYQLVQKLSSCQASTMRMKESTSDLEEKSLIITVNCRNSGRKTYEFSMNSFSLKLINEQENKIQEAAYYPTGTARLLQTNTTNGTAVCGDGVISGNQTCDDGNTNSSDGCSSTCVKQVCGDGIINNKNETCDDGNTVSGDGCSSTCQLQCGNSVLDAGETCDDGNRVDGDGCSSTCQLQTVSPALPLALGIPLVVLALVGLIGAKVALTKGAAAAGTTYLAREPARVVQVEESTKIVRVEDPHYH